MYRDGYIYMKSNVEVNWNMEFHLIMFYLIIENFNLYHLFILLKLCCVIIKIPQGVQIFFSFWSGFSIVVEVTLMPVVIYALA